VYLKTKFLILFLFGGLSLYGQSFMYSYTDPCTFELKTITYDMTTPVVVSYYGQTRAFTYDEMQNGAFDSWLNTVYSQFASNPCQGVLVSTTTTSTTNLTTNVINTVLNLNVITNLSSISGMGNNLGGTVNSGSNVNNNKKEDKKDEKNNNNPNSSNPSSGSSDPNTTTGSSESGNGGGTSPSSSGSSGTSGSEGSGSSETTGSSSSGGSSSSSSGSSSGSTGGSEGNNGQGGSGGENGQPTKEEINDTKTEATKSNSSNISKTTAKAKNDTQKPAILLTGDIVGLQKTADGSQDARGTVSYTRVKGDGTSSLGLSADYMLNAKIGNLTLMRSWIGTNQKGNKHINLVSSGVSFSPGSFSNTSMFIRVNSLKKFTAIYGAAGSYGRLYREELISGLLIAGGMYKGKLAKKLDATVILACVYPPYTKYYTQDWFKSTPVIVPFFNFNYKMTKTFGIGLTGGTTYMAGQNVVNYQVLLGAKLIL